MGREFLLSITAYGRLLIGATGAIIPGLLGVGAILKFVTKSVALTAVSVPHLSVNTRSPTVEKLTIADPLPVFVPVHALVAVQEDF